MAADSDLLCEEVEGGVAPVANACASPPLPLGGFRGELAWFDECGLPDAGPLTAWAERGAAGRSLVAGAAEGAPLAAYAVGSPRYVELDHSWLSIDLSGYLAPPPGGEAVFVVVGRFPPPEPPATSCVLALGGMRLQFRIDRPELELVNMDARLATDVVRDHDVHVFALILAPFDAGYRASVLVDGVGKRDGLLGRLEPDARATIASCTGARSEVEASILGAFFMSGVGGRQLALDVMNHWLTQRMAY